MEVITRTLCNMFIFLITLQRCVEAMCQSHRDCVTFQSPFSNRRYCCNRRFCCTGEQFRDRLRDDPVVSLSIGAIIAIVLGVIIFFIILAIFVAYFCKKKKRTTLPQNIESQNSPQTNTGNGDLNSSGRHAHQYEPSEYGSESPRLPSAPWYAPPPSRELKSHNIYGGAPPPYDKS